MEYGTEKYTLPLMKSEKIETMEGIELLNPENIKRLKEKENTWEYWKQTPPEKKRNAQRVLKRETISGKQNFWKPKFLKTKICSRSLIK